MEFVKAMDKLPLIVKIILAIPMLDVIWVIYRLVKSLAKNNTIGIVLAVVLLFVGIPFLWIVDMIFLVLNGKVLWVD
ncbi:MAG TPA: hypothetical protein VJZ48_04025 [Bacilli bacterium]|jgi:hypothetical protein|nr:hypothetical protein [Bacilli bacterium]